MAVEFKYDFESALAVIVYISSRGLKNLDKYKLGKLIFLSDKLHLVKHSRTITGDKIVALQYGPIPSNTLEHLDDMLAGKENEYTKAISKHLNVDRSFRYPHFSTKQEIDYKTFLSNSDIRAIDETIAVYGEKTFDELKVLTHEMPAYKNVWENRKSNNPTMKYEDLFAEDGDAMRGAYEEMIDNDQLRNAFGSV